MTDIIQDLENVYWISPNAAEKNAELVCKRAAEEIKQLRVALHYIANDYVELSHDKAQWQRDDHMKMARKALAESYKDETVELKSLDNDF